MNACSNRRVSKGPVFHSLHAATRVSDVGFAAGVARLFGVRGSRKVRPFAANQSGTLLCFGLFGRNPAKSELPDFIASFFASRISAKIVGVLRMAFIHVFLHAKALKVFQPIIRFIPVDVVDLFVRIKTNHPEFGNKPMDKGFAREQISRWMLRGNVRPVLSKDFPAARNSVKMVKHTVFNAVHRKVDHVVPPRLVTGIIF